MRKLGKYEVLGELGHGAMGVVYRARDPIISRMVALKTITTGLADDPNLLQRFYREAQSAGGLQHPNIVTIYDMGDERSTPYIAMELIEGESLEQTIARRESVPLVLKISYALQACRAFDYAHKRGIVHRDIKPGNVMVNKEGVIKVVDFGIARILDASKTQTGMLIGTFAYMSPEQYKGEHADERSDIWSFGVLLYELLCYQRPFTGENPASVMNSICTQQHVPVREHNAQCPPAIDDVVAKLLRKTPEDRFQSMEDVLLELEPIYKELQTRSIEELINESSHLIEQGEFARARELLRESLKVDSANVQARALLDRVNAERRRMLLRPKAQQQVEKGRLLLQEGKIQEARAEVEGALQLDSNFEEAKELEQQIQREIDRVRTVAECLQTAAKRLAEGMLDEAEELLTRVMELDAANKQAKDLQQQIAAERAERKRRLRFLEQMQQARGMWTQFNYDGCMAILRELEKEFPGEEEIQRLAETIREDQAEQQKQKTLERARDLFAASHFEESRALLAELQRQFPADEEIPRLLEDIRLDEAKQRKLQGLAEAKTLLTNRQYNESIALLAALEREYGSDPEILQLLEAARADQAEQQREQGIRDARNLLAARRYDECLTLVAELQSKFPNDKEIVDLPKAVREDQSQHRKQESLAKARSLLAAGHGEESMSLLTKLKDEFPADGEVRKLLDTARAERAEEQRQKGIADVRNLLAARRYDQCNELLAKLQEQFPTDLQLLEFQKTVLAEQLEQQRLQGIAEAKNLLAARRYEECDALLSKLGEEFPNDLDIAHLGKALEEGRLEQQKLERVMQARNLLAAKNFEGSILILAQLGREFPGDEDVRQLLRTARADQAEQQRRQGIAEVRKVLAARRYGDSTALLAKLQEQFPDDPEISQLREAVLKEQGELERLESLAKVRHLLAKRNFDDGLALLSDLGKKFPDDGEVVRLERSARDGLAELRKLKSLKEARTLLAARRYDESVSLLTELKKEFPDDREIPRLLGNAGREQAAKQRQQELAAARTLLAEQRFDDALKLLDTLRAAQPSDTAVQKLRVLVERERDKQTRSERLRRELEALKKLFSENKYAELLAQAEPLRADYPTNPDLLRLVDFARRQQSRIESEERLRTAVDDTQAHLKAQRFTEALEAADAALKAFPGNTELVHLREQVELQEKKQRARGMIEQRIREIKFKINREEFSDALSLAKETIATIGPDTNLTHLLNSAAVEMQARDKKRQQEQKLQEIRTLMDSGNVDGAAQTLYAAVQAADLDAFDPQVSRMSSQIDATKNAPKSTGAPAAPPGFSKEYAFLQGRPLETEPPPATFIEPTATGLPRASAAQPATRSQPAVPLPPPRSAEAPPGAPAPAATPPRPEPILPASPKNRVALPAERKQPPKKPAATAVMARPPAWKRITLWGPLALVLSLGVWTAVHVSSHHRAPTGLVPAQQPGEIAPSRPATTSHPSAPPAVNAIEVEQKSAMAAADKLIASGDWTGALRALEGAEKQNGPLTAEIKDREVAVKESMRNASLAKLRQQESKLWTKATDEVARGEFAAAKRDLRKVLAVGDGGVHRAEAQNYLSVEIPKRQKEESLFLQAQQSAQATNQRGLQHADDLLGQVIALNGPRRPQAQELQRNIESKLASLKQAQTSQQLAALEATGRSDIQRGDLNAARQQVDRIQQVGGDPSALLAEIEQARASQARAARRQSEYQQAIKEYSAVGSRDQAGLEKSRNDFLAIVKKRGPQAASAQQYVAQINKKLEALNEKPAPSAPAITTAPSNADADEAAIRDLIQRYAQAFDDRNADELRQIWPTIGKRYGRYKSSFGMASSIRMDVAVTGPIRTSAGGTAATVRTTVSQDFGIKGGRVTSHKDTAVFELAKKDGKWWIADVH